MREVVNTQQAEAWNGPEGEHWAAHHDRWNAVNQGFNDPLLTAADIGEHDRVLDIGCGAGQTTRLAARRATLGRVVGLDLSGPMLAMARDLAAAEGLHNVAFEQGDAQAHPLPPGGFDLAISRFGVMFFNDPVAAFANIGRALRPGGHLTFVCMADPARVEWVRVLASLRDLLPLPDFSPGAPGMFSLADPDTVSQVLADAGFDTIGSSLVEAAGRWGRDADDAADFLLGSGPGRFLLSQVDEAARRDARAALVGALRDYQRLDGVLLSGAAWLVTASRP